MKGLVSFKLDDTAVNAPYVTKVGKLAGRDGNCGSKYRIRLFEPNKEDISTTSFCTLRQLIEFNILDYLKDEIVGIYPMGCRTGFYLTISGEREIDEVQNIIIEILEKVLNSEELRGDSLPQVKKYVDDIISKFKGKKV